MFPRLVLEKASARWGAALLAYGVATVLRMWLDAMAHDRLPMVPYLPALAIVGLVSGLAPGLLVMLLSSLSLLLLWQADAMVLMLYLGAGGIALAVCIYARSTLIESALLRRRLQLALDQLRTEAYRKDTFLATLAHELRNPIAPIRYAVTMLERTTDDAARAHAVGVIARQSAHMARLLDDLLDVSRITRNVIELRREVLDLREVVRQVLESARGLIQEAGHELVTHMPEQQVRVDGDPTRLEQVLGNLLDNAVKYTPSGGRITVSLAVERTTHGAQAVLAVADTGLGLDPGALPRAFEVFTQLHRQPQWEDVSRGGLGIGLAVVKRLAELHGGQVDGHSDGPGQGSIFSVRLPVADGAICQAPEPEPAPAPVAGFAASDSSPS